MQRLIVHIYKQANERSGAFVDHTGVLIDARTGSALVVDENEEENEDNEDGKLGTGLAEEEDPNLVSGYSFFDSGEMEQMGGYRRRMRKSVGTLLFIFDLMDSLLM